MPSVDTLEIHEEYGSPDFQGEREITHVVLADLFDFIPQVVITDMKKFKSEAKYTNTFPVEKIVGKNVDEYIRDCDYRAGINTLRQVAIELHAFVAVGISAGERIAGHMLVDQSGKVWQIDLEGSYDWVRRKSIGDPESLRVNFSSPNRMEHLSEDTLRELKDVENRYVELITNLILSFYRQHLHSMNFLQKMKWNRSIFGKIISNKSDWRLEKEFYSNTSLLQLEEALKKLA